MWSVQNSGHVTIPPSSSEVSQQYQATLETQKNLVRGSPLRHSNLVKHGLLLRWQLMRQKSENGSALLYLLTLKMGGTWLQSFVTNCRLVLQLSNFPLWTGTWTQLLLQAVGFAGTPLVAKLGLVLYLVSSFCWWAEAYQHLAAMASLHSWPLKEMNSLYILHSNTDYAGNIWLCS